MSDSATKTRPVLAVDKYVRQAPRHEPESEETSEAFREGRARSREALMLDVILSDGRIESFDYATVKRMTYMPDGTLILRFGKDRITVEGHNLQRLRTAVTECRARLIQEGTEAEQDLKPGDAAHIERISIVEGEE